jgi:multiple sugar transport system substrate-binding protein
MKKEKFPARDSGYSRRSFLALAGATAFLGAQLRTSRRVRAASPELRILQWKHFVPGYDTWFDGEFVPAWAEANKVQVTVDHVGLSDIEGMVAREAKAGSGHDLVMLQSPTAVYEDAVLDHNDIYKHCISRHGPVENFAIRATHNPKTGKYFGFCTAYQPAMTIFRKSLWDSVGASPDSWEEVRRSGRRIKLLHQKTVGISLGPEHNAEQTLRAILASFGGSVQDGNGNAALSSPATVEAVTFVKALYQEAMPADVTGWNPTTNNTLMLTGECSLTVDTMSITRAGEAKRLEVGKDLWLAAVPKGPASRLAPPFGIHIYFIWKFAKNVELAKRFLVDYTAASRAALRASGFQNLPSFASTVPDLTAIVSDDADASPTDKYKILASCKDWTINIGYPGFDSAAVSEIYEERLVSRMFAAAATGTMTPADAVADAAKKVDGIFEKWRALGKI